MTSTYDAGNQLLALFPSRRTTDPRAVTMLSSSNDDVITVRRGCIILLDIPPSTAITLDGVTRITPPPTTSSSSTSSSLAGSMVIIDNIPSSTTDTDFHLLIVKKSNLTNINGGGHALPVGFILVPTTTTDDDGYYDWTFVRKYDIYNEEISNDDKPMDEISMKNLLLALRNGELYHCTIQYDQFMKNNTTTSLDSNGGLSSPNDDAIGQYYGNNSNGIQCLPSWDVRSSMINSNFLHVCHDIKHGCKIVPSSNIGSRGSTYGFTTTDTVNDDDDDDDDAMNNTVVEDGKSITYPAIPCIDTTITNNIRLVTRHTGTRLYLSTLSPKERTRLLFVNSSVDDDDDDRKETEENNNNAERSQPVGENVFEDVLRRYDNSNNNDRGDISCSRGEEYFLADIELSFLLFIHLECHVSLEHWRDSISMCALATITAAAAVRSSTKPTTTSIVYRRSSFFHTLLSILYQQLLCIEVDFFREVEYSAGEENFLVVALQRLYSACANEQQSDSVDTTAAAAASKRKRGNDGATAAASTIENLKSASLKLKRLLIDRFGLDLSTTTNKEIDDVDDDDDDDDMESDALWSTMGHDYVNDDEDTDEIADLQEEGNTHHRESMDIGHVKDSSNYNTDDDDEDDDDGPVIIPYEDVEASLARSTLLKTINQRHQLQVGKAQRQQCEKYPLLYAAMSSGEDEVMACARILDEARDVSLVREAASYLEEVEVHREWRM